MAQLATTPIAKTEDLLPHSMPRTYMVQWEGWISKVLFWPLHVCYDMQKTCIHICTHTHIYILIHINIHIHTYTYKYTDKYTHFYIYAYAHIYIYTKYIHKHTYAYTHTYKPIVTYTPIYTSTHIHIYIHTHTNSYTYMYLYTYTLTHARTHARTYRIPLKREWIERKPRRDQGTGVWAKELIRRIYHISQCLLCVITMLPSFYLIYSSLKYYGCFPLSHRCLCFGTVRWQWLVDRRLHVMSLLVLRVCFSKPSPSDSSGASRAVTVMAVLCRRAWFPGMLLLNIFGGQLWWKRMLLI